ncbi:HNH endonuclease family protein [Thiomicrorhabdus aquaedulcis]|uniref:HNH endonuclease family protein n=1 Tax=Thiomicrorhabdus aquaedulcis TaxID=2211106 RepID=UPI000FDB2A32|nr:DUF262 domain-containing protein [Thiomicrorhabdus aquaedulcis]
MNIELKKIKIENLVQRYYSHPDNGVYALDGNLNVRPAYQREFVYKDAQRDAVIETVMKGYPLNTIYWAKNSDETFEVLDGQQRTISICEFAVGNFSINYRSFYNLHEDEKNKFLDYELMVYVCSGSESEKLEWFKTINIAGEKLLDQELRNAIYTGAWLVDAKKYFSRQGGAAHAIGKDYLKGHAIRQEYLETAIFWHSHEIHNHKPNIEKYMSEHQHENSAVALWMYYERVIGWVKAIFTNYRKEMKGLPWGVFFNLHSATKLDPVQIESKIKTLMQDEDVTNKRGVYEYILSGDEKHLNVRAFDEKMRREAYERQVGICPITGEHYPIADMEADHIIPWSQGGKTNAENCQMIEKFANRTKSNK